MAPPDMAVRVPQLFVTAEQVPPEVVSTGVKISPVTSNGTEMLNVSCPLPTATMALGGESEMMERGFTVMMVVPEVEPGTLSLTVRVTMIGEVTLAGGVYKVVYEPLPEIPATVVTDPHPGIQAFPFSLSAAVRMLPAASLLTETLNEVAELPMVKVGA